MRLKNIFPRQWKSKTSECKIAKKADVPSSSLPVYGSFNQQISISRSGGQTEEHVKRANLQTGKYILMP